MGKEAAAAAIDATGGGITSLMYTCSVRVIYLREMTLGVIVAATQTAGLMATKDAIYDMPGIYQAPPLNEDDGTRVRTWLYSSLTHEDATQQ